MSRWARVLLAALTCASCGQPLMKLPSGPGSALPDARDALAQATAPCQAVRTLTAEVAVKGSLADRKVRARMLAGFQVPSSARLEAVAAFGPLFVLVARENDGTLLLPHDNEVLEHGPPAEILEAIAGLRLDGSDLRMAMTGCAPQDGPREARQLADGWIVVRQDASDSYLHRDSAKAAWQLVAAIQRGDAGGEWRREYRDFHGGLPSSVRLMRAGARPVDLQLTLSQVEINPEIAPEAFQVRVPASAAPITLQALRDRGPLAVGTHGR